MLQRKSFQLQPPQRFEKQALTLINFIMKPIFTTIQQSSAVSINFAIMNVTIKDLIQQLETWAPPALQEDYDNSGLICGRRQLSHAQAP
jgi:hypothetical protein